MRYQLYTGQASKLLYLVDNITKKIILRQYTSYYYLIIRKPKYYGCDAIGNPRDITLSDIMNFELWFIDDITRFSQETKVELKACIKEVLENV